MLGTLCQVKQLCDIDFIHSQLCGSLKSVFTAYIESHLSSLKWEVL